jgi:iron complex outermembrane recepter protein
MIDVKSGRYRAAPSRQVGLRAFATAGVFGVILAVTAHADDQAPAPQLETVVVTAEKRATPLQDLAAPVTAITGQQLDLMGITDFRDLATSVPSLTFVPLSDTTTKIVLRGISTGNLNDASSSGTGLYLDDVPMSSAYGPGGEDINMTDLKRVEVLRGPQGTLYGAGSEGGTVRYITNQPDLSQFGGDVNYEGEDIDGASAAFGSYADGVLNIPLITNTLGLRIVAWDRDDQGWISSPTRNVDRVNGVRLAGGRVALRWDLNSDWSITMMGLYQNNHDDGGPYVDETANKVPLGADLTQVVGTIGTPGLITDSIASLLVHGDLGWATLTSSTSYSDFDRHQSFDDTHIFPFDLGTVLVPGTTAVPEVFYSEDRDYTEELRLASAGSGPLTWLTGVFLQDYQLPGDRSATTLGGPYVSLFDIALTQKRKTYAAFGEASYEFASAWTVTLGGRIERVDSAYDQGLSGALVGGNLVNTTSGSNDYFTPKAELSYKLSQHNLLYVLYSEGYRPGGSNLKYNTVSIPATYSSDTVKNYEVGAKTAWLDGRLIANLAAYHEEFTGLQVVVAKGGLPYFANAGKAASNGVELELDAVPIKRLTLRGWIAYDHAYFVDASPALSAFAGEGIPQVPHWSLSASADYNWAIQGDENAFVHLDGRYVASSPAGAGVLEGIDLSAYRTLNARTGLNLGSLQVALFADNLTNVRAQLGVSPVVPTASSVPITSIDYLRMTVLQPRTIGVKVGYVF